MKRSASITAYLVVMIFAMLRLAVVCAEAGPTFVEVPMEAGDGRYAGVAAGDVDKDGRAEILAGRRDGAEGLCLFSFEGGRWGRTQIRRSGQYGGVALADLTGDGVPDVIAVKTDGRPAGLELFRTRLNGGEPRFDPLASPFTEKGCDDVAVGDIESDGDLDLALATRGAGIQVLLNEGDGESFRRLSLPTDVYEDSGIGMGDVNGDGRLDVVSSNHPGENLRLFLCSDSGRVSYGPARTEGLPGAGIGFKIVIADFNGDDHGDLAVGSQREGVRIFYGNGCSGPESSWWRETRPAEHGRQTMQISAGDLNGDGRPDLAFSSNRGIIAVLNRGGGSFSSRLRAGLPERGGYAGCHLFDHEGDGDLDLVCTSFQGKGCIRFFENREK